METHIYDPDFMKEYQAFGLKYPEWLPCELDKLTLEFFFHAGKTTGILQCRDQLLEKLQEG